MVLADRQVRGQQQGRLRLGKQVDTGRRKPNGDKIYRPVASDTFLFTTGSRWGAEAIAARYDSTVKPWGDGEWCVETDATEITVLFPPRGELISQWYEMWSAAGCLRRCDSRTNIITGGGCECPHADDPGNLAEVEKAALARYEMAHMNPPRACKETTRVRFQIPDLPGVGLFRIDTHSYWTSVEIGDIAAILAEARKREIFLPGAVRISKRSRTVNGETTRFKVLAVDLLVTLRQIVSGELEAGGIAAQLPPAPGEPLRALTAAPPAPAVQRVPAADLNEARDYALRAEAATTSAEVRQLKNAAGQAGVLDDEIEVPGTDGTVFDRLTQYLFTRHQALRAQEAAARRAACSGGAPGPEVPADYEGAA